MNPVISVASSLVLYKVKEPLQPSYEQMSSPAAVEFLTDLQLQFNKNLKQLLRQRTMLEDRFDQGGKPDFPADRQEIRDAAWGRSRYGRFAGSTDAGVKTAGQDSISIAKTFDPLGKSATCWPFLGYN
jgi:malate synthase